MSSISVEIPWAGTWRSPSPDGPRACTRPSGYWRRAGCVMPNCSAGQMEEVAEERHNRWSSATITIFERLPDYCFVRPPLGFPCRWRAFLADDRPGPPFEPSEYSTAIRLRLKAASRRSRGPDDTGAWWIWGQSDQVFARRRSGHIGKTGCRTARRWVLPSIGHLPIGLKHRRTTAEALDSDFYRIAGPGRNSKPNP